ncbi:MAG: hypothetical protein K2L83_01490 [Muribaculaceae bacterium]|nr:hypothetical protein [Muribaculaceae bacterium]
MADKYVYIQKPADNGDVKLWWWGDQSYAADYTYPGPNLKNFELKGDYPKVESVTGTDGNAYYKVGLQDGTTGMKINDNNGDITIDFTRCYSSTGATLGLVSEIIKEQGGEDPDPTPSGDYVFYLGGEPFGGWNGEYKKEENKLTYIGNNTYQITGVSIENGKYFSIYASANGADFKQYNYSDRNISGTVDSPVALVQNSDAIQSSVALKDVTFTLYVNGEGNYTLSITPDNQVVDPVIETVYTWAAKESAEKAFELVLKDGVYTLSNALSNVPQAFYLECTKKVYVDNVEDTTKRTTTVYGWTNHTGLEPNGEITLWKENKPITFAEGYENFNLSFAHVDDMPGSVKVNFTATKEVKVEMPQVVSIKTYKRQGDNGQVWEFDTAPVEDGVAVVKKVYLSGGFNFRFRYDASTEEYHSISGENTWNVTSKPTSFANFFNVIDCGGEGEWQKVDGASSGVYYDITFNFNDLTYTIVEHVEQVEPSKVTTVYFIDRQNWGNLHCYNYTDKGDLGGGKNDNNGIFPGQKMEDITENPAYAEMMKGIQGLSAQGYRVYKIDLTKTQLEADGYTMPKIIFSNGTSGAQSANLYLVKDGIYTNGTPSNLNEGQIAVKASDYLPRQWYKADAEEGEQCVYTYPNDEVSTPYNYIYVDVDHYTDTYNDGKRVSVQIEYTLNGQTFVATGLSGTHYLSLVNINGKDYLRVAIAEDVIPDGTTIKLVVWENPDNKYGGINPDVSGNWSGQGCKHGVCDATISGNKHLDCPMSSGCPLIFTNATFTNGALFTRSSEQDNILTKTMPTRMYVVDAAQNGAFNLAGLKRAQLNEGEIENAEGVYEPIKVADYVAYDVTSTLVDGEYVIPNVPQKADFYMLGAYDTNEGTVYHVFSNKNNPEMLPGNNYGFRYNEQGRYTITDAFGTSREYTITIHWADQSVSVRTEAKPNAFQLGQNRDNGGYVGVNSQIAHMMFAVADNADTFDEIHIMHAAEFDPDTYKDSHSVMFKHNAEYDAFMAGRLNKVVSDADYDGTLTNADPSSGTNSTHSTVGARAFTAGIYTLTVSNDDAEGITAATSDIPVRVIPTLESTGLTLNYHPIPSSADGSFDIELDELSDEEFKDGDYSYGPERVGLFPTLADYIVEGKTADETLQIWWAYLTDATAQNSAVSAYSVVQDYNGLKATENPFGTPAENGLARYSYKNALSNDGMKAAKGFRFQIVQNGITSPLYTVNVSDNITTGVEELGVEDVEAVYYDLNGVKVDGTNLAKGIYVKVVGTKATKVIVK